MDWKVFLKNLLAYAAEHPEILEELIKANAKLIAEILVDVLKKQNQ